MNQIFIGFTHVGKTSIGQKLAETLQKSFFDTDAMIGRHLFKEIGEEAFRKKEHAALLELQSKDDCIIATGGGLPLLLENRLLLRAMGKVIYLKASPDLLFSRIQGRPGFLQERETFQEAYEKRACYYEECAHLTIETDGLSCEQVIQQLMK